MMQKGLCRRVEKSPQFGDKYTARGRLKALRQSRPNSFALSAAWVRSRTFILLRILVT